MNELTSIVSTVTASFLASFVEVVEAFTIVLAVGITRSWRPALTGTLLAFIVLAALVAIFGPLLALVPLHVLQFVVGVLLILFGMRWLRKAILRASGFIALHNEEKVFSEETELLHRQAVDRRADYLAGLAAFKAVLLEGVEVVFIVIAVGATHGFTGFASLGALAAFVLVLAIGLVVHKPLARVPENTLKFVVGLMLTSFGIFWTGEGIGAAWPGADLVLFLIFAVLAVFSGRLHIQKDYPTLIKAFAMVRSARSARLVIISEGRLRRRLQGLNDSLKLGDDVVLAGYTENPFAWMSRASLFILSSAWEGLGSVLIEALACGCPVVSTNCPSGPSEILQGGNFGTLVACRNPVSMANAILLALDQRPDQEALRNRAQAFSVSSAVNSYSELFGLCFKKIPGSALPVSLSSQLSSIERSLEPDGVSLSS